MVFFQCEFTNFLLLTDGCTGSSLVQIMACRLFGAKPLSKPVIVWLLIYRIIGNRLLWKKKCRNKQILIHESHLTLSFVILPPFCLWVEALNNISYRTGIHGWDAESYIGDVVSKAHNGAKISFNGTEYFQLQHEWWHADGLIYLKILGNLPGVC